MKIELLIIALLGMVSGELFVSNNPLLFFFAPCLILYSGMTRGSVSGLISAVFASVVIFVTINMNISLVHVSNRIIFLKYIQEYLLIIIFLFTTLIARRETLKNKADQVTKSVKWISLGVFLSISSTILSLFFCSVFIYYKFKGLNYIDYLSEYVSQFYILIVESVKESLKASPHKEELDFSTFPKEDFVKYLVSYFPLILSISTIFFILIKAKLTMGIARLMKRLLRPSLGFENAVVPYAYSIFFIAMIVCLLCLNLYKNYSLLPNYDDVHPFTYSMIRIMLVPYFFYSFGFVHSRLKRMNTFLPTLVYSALFMSLIIFGTSNGLGLYLSGYLSFFFVHALHGVYRNLLRKY